MDSRHRQTPQPGPTHAGDGAPLRVTVVCGHGELGGAENWLLSMLDGTDRLLVDAVVLAEGPLVGALRARGLAVTVLPTGPGPADLAGAAVRLAGHLRGDADIVVANGVKAAVATVPAGRLASVRTVWVKHDHVLDGPATRLLARTADGVVATGPALAAATGRAETLLLEPPRRATEHLDREEARRLLGVPDGVPLLLTVGRLVAYKGNDDAITALARPAAARWHLAVVGGAAPGEPGEGARLRALAERLGVADRVHVCGPVPDAAALMAGADAVAVLTKPTASGRRLLPRTPGTEGYGMVAAEAMAAGRAVVATGPGPVADRVGRGAGVVVPVADPDAVAAALAELADPSVRAAMGEAGRAVTAATDDVATAADRFAAHLSALARRPGAGLAGGPPISVVTTVLDERQGLADLLDGVLPQLRDDDELVVVDGGSTDGTPDVVRDHPLAGSRLRLVVEPGAGISAGRNVGVRAARHDWLAFTDAGCTPEPGWLDGLRRAAGERPAPALVTGVYRAESPPPALTRLHTAALSEAFAAVGYPTVPETRRPSLLVRAYTRVLGQAFDPTLPTGRSMAVHRTAWESAGGFPEHLQTAEDVLFGRRVVDDGGTAVLSTDAEVAWVQRDDVRATARMYRAYGRGGGLAGSRLLVGRDLARGAAYAAGLAGLKAGGPVRAATLAAAVAYLSLPLARARRRRVPVATALAVPVAAGIRDVSKAVGTLEGLLRRRRDR